MDAAEYEHIVLGLIFVKYISDTFQTRCDELTQRFADADDDYFLHEVDAEMLADELEDRDYYKEVNVFWVPEAARWEALRTQAKQADIGKRIDDALSLCVHTMYVDKPMKDHNLMQAIARVNRVFRDKQGGLVVDYIGIASDLKQALKEYTASKGRGRPTVDAHEAYAVLEEKLDVLRAMLHGFDYSGFLTGGHHTLATPRWQCQKVNQGSSDAVI